MGDNPNPDLDEVLTLPGEDPEEVARVLATDEERDEEEEFEEPDDSDDFTQGPTQP